MPIFTIVNIGACDCCGADTFINCQHECRNRTLPDLLDASFMDFEDGTEVPSPQNPPFPGLWSNLNGRTFTMYKVDESLGHFYYISSIERFDVDHYRFTVRASIKCAYQTGLPSVVHLCCAISQTIPEGIQKYYPTWIPGSTRVAQLLNPAGADFIPETCSPIVLDYDSLAHGGGFAQPGVNVPGCFFSEEGALVGRVIVSE